MKKIVCLFILSQSIMCYCLGQVAALDTIYYDKNWKGVRNPAFASFYRVAEVKESINEIGMLRDFYITGELFAEGYFSSINKLNDAESVFEGERITYYKNGSTQSKVTFRNGKEEGKLLFYSEDGEFYTETEFNGGSPVNDYYLLKTTNGQSQKFRISDNSPIWESPNISELQSEYHKGQKWYIYNVNGIKLSLNSSYIKDYGKWYQVSLIVENNSITPIEFDPAHIKATLVDKTGESVNLEVWSVDEYIKKVRRTQYWNAAFANANEQMAAQNAAKSTTKTQKTTTSSGKANAYGTAQASSSSYSATGSYNAYGNYRGTSTTTTKTETIDNSAAYQAKAIADAKVSNYIDELNSDRAAKEENYLKKSTINPNDAIAGYVNIKYSKGTNLTIEVDINGAKFEFPIENAQ